MASTGVAVLLDWADAVAAAPRCKPMSTSARPVNAAARTITFLSWADILSRIDSLVRQCTQPFLVWRPCAGFLSRNAVPRRGHAFDSWTPQGPTVYVNACVPDIRRCA